MKDIAIRLIELRRTVAYWFFQHQLKVCISVLRLFGDRKRVKLEQLALQNCENGTIGKELHLFLDRNGLNLVPWYEAHDLKHVILGYNVTPPDEMKMQALMFGNSGFSWVITPIYLSFVIWTPSAWAELLYHFKTGLQMNNIGYDTIASVKNRSLLQYREEIGLDAARELAKSDSRSVGQVMYDEVKRRIITNHWSVFLPQ